MSRLSARNALDFVMGVGVLQTSALSYLDCNIASKYLLMQFSTARNRLRRTTAGWLHQFSEEICASIDIASAAKRGRILVVSLLSQNRVSSSCVQTWCTFAVSIQPDGCNNYLQSNSLRRLIITTSSVQGSGAPREKAYKNTDMIRKWERERGD